MKSEAGVTAIEYGLIAMLIALVDPGFCVPGGVGSTERMHERRT